MVEFATSFFLRLARPPIHLTCQGGELNSRPTPKAFGACSKLLEVEDCQMRIFLCFEPLLDLTRFAEGSHFLRGRESQFSKAASRVGMAASVQFESLIRSTVDPI